MKEYDEVKQEYSGAGTYKSMSIKGHDRRKWRIMARCTSGETWQSILGI
jgi:hypothetical protein